MTSVPDPDHLLRVASQTIAECLLTGDYRRLPGPRDRIDRELIRRDNEAVTLRERTELEGLRERVRGYELAERRGASEPELAELARLRVLTQSQARAVDAMQVRLFACTSCSEAVAASLAAQATHEGPVSQDPPPGFSWEYRTAAKWESGSVTRGGWNKWRDHEFKILVTPGHEPEIWLERRLVGSPEKTDQAVTSTHTLESGS